MVLHGDKMTELYSDDTYYKYSANDKLGVIIGNKLYGVADNNAPYTPTVSPRLIKPALITTSNNNPIPLHNKALSFLSDKHIMDNYSNDFTSINQSGMCFVPTSYSYIIWDVLYEIQLGGIYQTGITRTTAVVKNANVSLYDAIWTNSFGYRAGEIVNTSGDVIYICLLNHASSATNEPGVGASWSTYWGIVGQWAAYKTGGTKYNFKYIDLVGIHGCHTGGGRRFNFDTTAPGVTLTFTGLVDEGAFTFSWFNQSYIMPMATMSSLQLISKTEIFEDATNYYRINLWIYPDGEIFTELYHRIKSTGKFNRRYMRFFIYKNTFQNGQLYTISNNLVIDNLDGILNINDYFFKIILGGRAITYNIIDVGGGYYRLQLLQNYAPLASTRPTLIAETEPYNAAGDIVINGKFGLNGYITLLAGACSATATPVDLDVYIKVGNGVGVPISYGLISPPSLTGSVIPSGGATDFLQIDSRVTITGGADIVAGETWAVTPPAVTHAELQALLPP